MCNPQKMRHDFPGRDSRIATGDPQFRRPLPDRSLQLIFSGDGDFHRKKHVSGLRERPPILVERCPIEVLWRSQEGQQLRIRVSQRTQVEFLGPQLCQNLLELRKVDPPPFYVPEGVRVFVAFGVCGEGRGAAEPRAAHPCPATTVGHDAANAAGVNQFNALCGRW